MHLNQRYARGHKRKDSRELSRVASALRSEAGLRLVQYLPLHHK